MALKSVKATINGTTYNLTYDKSSGKYTADITAPTTTSYNEPDGYYPVEIKATDDAGNVSTKDGSNKDNQLIVKETVPPEISNLSPSENARLTTASPKISGTVKDEQDGSGINKDTLTIKIDGKAVSDADVTLSSISNGYDFEYKASGLDQGSHDITVDVDDNDGNSATQETASFIVDTIAPDLNISSPDKDLITNESTIKVKGKTTDKTSKPVTVTIKVNGTGAGDVSVGSNGSFEKSVSLDEGSNDIEIVAEDDAGLKTTISRTVTLNTSAPVIENVELVPNPVDAGETYVIKVKVTQ